MNQIYRAVFLFLFTTAAISLHAQDLAHKIPADALAVASIKGNNLLELLSINEFNTSFLGKKILEKTSREMGSKKYTDIQGLGISLESSLYYYNQANDSVSYNCLLIPLKDALKFDKLFSRDGKDRFSMNGNTRLLYSGTDSTEIMMWNEQMLFITKASAQFGYFDREDVAKRFAFEKAPDYGYNTAADTVSAENYDNDYPTADAEIAIEDPEVTMAKVAKPVKKNQKPKAVKSKRGKVVKKHSKAKKQVVIAEPVEEASQEIYTDTATMSSADTAIYLHSSTDDEYECSYSDYYTRNTAKQKRIMAGWAHAMAKDMLLKPASGSVLDNPSYIKSLDANAEATLWIPSTRELVNSYFLFPYIFKNSSFLTGYGELNSKLFLENDMLTLSTGLTFSDEVATSFKKMYDSKLNKKFLKYINEDRMIGCMAYSLNSKAYLEEYPKMMSKIYGPMDSDGAALAADLFSLLLDEEAVSNVFKGDGLFILSGLSQKDVTYKTYDYDDDYKSIEVEKTKKETVPDFLFMTSTKDTRLLEKLIRYGIKKEKISKNKDYYKIMLPKNLMDLYLIIKDDIIFLGTNVNEIEKIAANTYDSKISKDHKNMLLKTSFACYMNPKMLAGKIPVEESTEEYETDNYKPGKINDVLNDMGTVYFKADKMKGNTVSSEMLMQIPESYPNSLHYLFSVIEKLLK